MPLRHLLSLFLGVLSTVEATPVEAQSPNPSNVVKQLILPGEAFLVSDRPAFIFWPEKSMRRQPQPWVWYAPTLRGLPDKHEKWMHEQFLTAGIAVAGIDVGEAHGSPAGQRQFSALYKELVSKRNFAAKPCLLGRSRGGLHASGWAISNSDKVAGLAGIYPVFDLASYPGIKRAAPAYGFSSEQLTSRLAEFNPVSRVGVLADAGVPVFFVHGDVDKVVPIERNSQAVVREYERGGAGHLATLVVANGQGHNFWPGFFRCDALVAFVIDRAKAGATSSTGGTAVPE